MPMLYKRESFVQGFDITIGEFATLQAKCCVQLSPLEITEERLNSKYQYHFNSMLADVEAAVLNDTLMTMSDAPLHWRIHMVRQFVLACISIQRKKNANTPSSSQDSTNLHGGWQLGPNKEDLSRDAVNKYQFQHLSVMLHMFGGAEVLLPLRTFVNPVLLPSTITVKDLPLSHFSFKTMEEVVKAQAFNDYTASDFCFQYEGANDQFVLIHNDESLQTALVSMRKDKNDTVNIYLIEREQAS
jgi:hypothetical protein